MRALTLKPGDPVSAQGLAMLDLQEDEMDEANEMAEREQEERLNRNSNANHNGDHPIITTAVDSDDSRASDPAARIGSPDGTCTVSDDGDSNSNSNSNNDDDGEARPCSSGDGGGAAATPRTCIPLETRMVERVPASSLSLEQFRDTYMWEGTPVIITGDTAAAAAARTLTVANIVEQCSAGTNVTVNRRGAGKWAGQTPHRTMSLADFLTAKSLESSSSSSSSSSTNRTVAAPTASDDGGDNDSTTGKGKDGKDYLFDFNLQAHCSAMVEKLKIPSYVAQDLLQRTPKGT